MNERNVEALERIARDLGLGSKAREIAEGFAARGALLPGGISQEQWTRVHWVMDNEDGYGNSYVYGPAELARIARGDHPMTTEGG